jgi:hypothetical protein
MPGRQAPTPAIADIDLAGLAEALGDGGGEMTWWYDPLTGQVEITADFWAGPGTDDDNDDPFERGLVRIEPIGSRHAYRDMVEFAEAIADPRPADLLLRALEGRGAFRRFRDTLHELPDLRQRWLEFSNAADERRAIDWLLDEDSIDPDDAAVELARRSAIMTAVLEAVASPGGNTFDQATLGDRWTDIAELIDAGRTVTILRNGRPWATISPSPSR